MPIEIFIILKAAFQGVDEMLKRDYFICMLLVNILGGIRIIFAQRTDESFLRTCGTDTNKIEFLFWVFAAVAIIEKFSTFH